MPWSSAVVSDLRRRKALVATLRVATVFVPLRGAHAVVVGSCIRPKTKESPRRDAPRRNGVCAAPRAHAVVVGSCIRPKTKEIPRCDAPRRNGVCAAPRRAYRESAEVVSDLRRRKALVATLRVETVFVPLRGAHAVNRRKLYPTYDEGKPSLRRSASERYSRRSAAPCRESADVVSRPVRQLSFDDQFGTINHSLVRVPGLDAPRCTQGGLAGSWQRAEAPHRGRVLQ